ncbi:SET domain-containing protein [Dentipellis sp. KUC8613]|nr:SET domain-containing protein [Dentipellis sp. KUC8613]
MQLWSKVTMKSCTNMIMQVDLPQRLIIKRAKYGSGAFASKKIRKSAFIGEYTGEIIPNEQHSDVIEKYLDLNYGFDHDLKTYIDGMKLGNETRYLNHPSLKQKTNVEAMMIAVNGDQRIALFAKHRIEKDEELLLDYGEKYWQHHKNKRQSSDEDEF